jgi:hypothetical protein
MTMLKITSYNCCKRKEEQMDDLKQRVERAKAMNKMEQRNALETELIEVVSPYDDEAAIVALLTMAAVLVAKRRDRTFSAQVIQHLSSQIDEFMS